MKLAILLTTVATAQAAGFVNGNFDEGVADVDTYKVMVNNIIGWTNNAYPRIVKSGNQAWGGLESSSGSHYLALQGPGNWVEQKVTSLEANTLYTLSFAMTHRPGQGTKEKAVCTVNGETVWSAAGTNGGGGNNGLALLGDFTNRGSGRFHFTSYSVNVKSNEDGEATIRFLNDSPTGIDQTVFLDAVAIDEWTDVDTAQAAGFVNGNFDEGVADVDTYKVMNNIIGWTNNAYPTIVKSGNQAWGGLESSSGSHYLALQGPGNWVEQKVTSLEANTLYTLSFAMTHRPGQGTKEKAVCTVNGETVWSAAGTNGGGGNNGLALLGDFTHRGSGRFHFTSYSVNVKSNEDGEATIRFLNDSPTGIDQTVFLDAVAIDEWTSVGYTQVKTHHKCKQHTADRLFKTTDSTAAQCYEKCKATKGCKHFSVNTTPNTEHFGVCMGCSVGNWAGQANFDAYNVVNIADCKDWTCAEWCEWYDLETEKEGVYAANGCGDDGDECTC